MGGVRDLASGPDERPSPHPEACHQGALGSPTCARSEAAP